MLFKEALWSLTLASYLPKKHAKTLQSPPTAELALIKIANMLTFGIIAVDVVLWRLFLHFSYILWFQTEP